MEKIQEQKPAAEGLSFEQVWAILEKTARINEETARRQEEMTRRQEETVRIQEETARRQKRTERQAEKTERQAERTELQAERTELQFEKTEQQLEKTIQKLDEIGKNFGAFTNSFGDVVEHMIAPNLQEKFASFDYDFHQASTKVKIRDKKNDIRFEIDVYLENGETAMLVEIKSELLTSDINKHIERLGKMRRFADLRGDKRHFVGAVAGIVVNDEERKYALENGFFLIEPNGEDFFITSPAAKLRKW